MTLWIKICGLTTDDAVTAAVSAGVDAIGFVFAASKRQVSSRRAIALARNVPEHIKRVAVTLHPAQSLIDEICTQFRPDVLQTDAEDLHGLVIPPDLEVMPVLRAGREWAGPLPRRFLFEGPLSGVGQAADWQRAAQLAQRSQLVLAGGLHPGNVAEAVASVNPFGVDVSSGVEREPGIKDVVKIEQFVRAARSGARANSDPSLS